MVFFKTTYCARILIDGTRFPPFGFDIAEVSSNSKETLSFFDCARSLIEGARFPRFWFDIAEVGYTSKEEISLLQKDLLCPHSDREHSVSPRRVRYSGDKH